MNGRTRHLTSALTLSVAVHICGILTLLLLLHSLDAGRKPDAVAQPRSVRMVWIPDSRPAARGGGGRPMVRKPTTAASRAVPTPSPPVVDLQPQSIAPKPEPRAVDDKPPSTPRSAEGDSNSQPAGSGDSNASGSGAGPQSGPGSGGFIYGVGNGVTPPIPVRRPPPSYTAEAMRARVQGVVVLNCVVQSDGTCSDIRVMRSLDPVFGLDQEAIASAREWRFRPGVRLGEPVPVRVTLEIAFSIR